MRVLGFEPKTYALKDCKPEIVTPYESNSYKNPENHLTANLTENVNTIQQDLTKISNCWPLLPPNIKAAIMVLIEDNDGKM